MHDYTPLYAPFPPAAIAVLAPLIILLLIWTIALKGLALWHAARGSQKKWFIVLLVVNTLGILELAYLIWFRKHSTHASAPEHHSSARV